MSYFKNMEVFLGVIRKYMQIRGVPTQKELAELVQVGESTMSRFLSMKSSVVDEQLVAKICSKLNIPTHEVIDFVEEDATDKFRLLVQFHKDQDKVATVEAPAADEVQSTKAKITVGGRQTTIPFSRQPQEDRRDLSLKEKLERLTPKQKRYMSDFLELDLEARDLIADIGDTVFRYLKQKEIDL